MNQTKGLTAQYTQKAFQNRLETFRHYQQLYDPENRMMNHYFKELLAQ